jgi:hypothetical protein
LTERLLGKWRNPNLLTPWFHILISTLCKYCVTFSFATYILIMSIWVLKAKWIVDCANRKLSTCMNCKNNVKFSTVLNI